MYPVRFLPTVTPAAAALSKRYEVVQRRLHGARRLRRSLGRVNLLAELGAHGRPNELAQLVLGELEQSARVRHSGTKSNA
jgi:hypothetical protein